MDFNTFVEGPLLWIAFLIFIVGIVTRALFFSTAVIKADRKKDVPGTSLCAIMGRALIPFHMGAAKKPIYAALRYLFHICLIVVPIWLAGHVVLWSESRFGWEWTALPAPWADGLTILFLIIVATFLIRRLTFKEIRRTSSPADFLLLIITAVPFLSGYFLAQGTLDSIPFFRSNIGTIHILSSEVMLIATAFLFYRIRFNAETCTGCAACESMCPTGTLEFIDEGETRTFFYSMYRCICCGSCFKACPEEAAELRHVISLRDFFGVFSRNDIRNVELAACEGCGALFAPEPLLDRVAKTIIDDYSHYCSTCKKTKLAANFHKLAPWPEK